MYFIKFKVAFKSIIGSDFESSWNSSQIFLHDLVRIQGFHLFSTFFLKKLSILSTKQMYADASKENDEEMGKRCKVKSNFFQTSKVSIKYEFWIVNNIFIIHNTKEKKYCQNAGVFNIFFDHQFIRKG